MYNHLDILPLLFLNEFHLIFKAEGIFLLFNVIDCILLSSLLHQKPQLKTQCFTLQVPTPSQSLSTRDQVPPTLLLSLPHCESCKG